MGTGVSLYVLQEADYQGTAIYQVGHSALPLENSHPGAQVVWQRSVWQPAEAERKLLAHLLRVFPPASQGGQRFVCYSQRAILAQCREFWQAYCARNSCW